MTLRGPILALVFVALTVFPCRGQPPLPAPDPVVKYATHTNTIGWDDAINPKGTRYRLLIGWSPGNYRMTNDAGTSLTQTVIWPTARTSYYNVIAYNAIGSSTTNGEIRLPRAPRADTNILVTVKGSNLMYALTLLSAWRTTNATLIAMTNPAGDMFFRGSGRTIITRTNF